MPVPAGSESRAASARARLRAFVDPAAFGEAEPRRALDEPEPEESAPDEPPAAEVGGGARRFERRHLAAVALLVACGLAFGVWQLMRARSVPVAPASARPSIVGAVRSSVGLSPSAAPLVVHVVGAVQRPGVVRLPPGARVTDAIDAAGGLTPDADPAQLNLAAQLNDGEQVVVGTRGSPAGEVRGGAGAAPSGGGQPGAGQVNLNTATQAQLEALPGVGPVTAGKILQWRQQHGRFTRVEELGEVDGIGPKTLAQLKPYVRV